MIDEQNNANNEAAETASQQATQTEMNDQNSQQHSSNASADSQELTQCKQRLMFAQAEFENYKKRVEKERTSWIARAQDQVIIDILPIVDDMERAFSGLDSQKASGQVGESSQEGAQSHVKGFELILKALQKMLKEYEVEEIPYVAQFDPELFEAIMQVQSPEHQSGDIVTIFKKGYRRQGRVLRPAQVSVAQ